jgi:hypothetical protein
MPCAAAPTAETARLFRCEVSHGHCCLLMLCTVQPDFALRAVGCVRRVTFTRKVWRARNSRGARAATECDGRRNVQNDRDIACESDQSMSASLFHFRLRTLTAHRRISTVPSAGWRCSCRVAHAADQAPPMSRCALQKSSWSARNHDETMLQKSFAFRYAHPHA